ncbi:hypothetical protein N7528_004712 [Penicillium herquei]|nr:hypothetical protein N7528_004712 [Penicillium herquei]
MGHECDGSSPLQDPTLVGFLSTRQPPSSHMISNLTVRLDAYKPEQEANSRWNNIKDYRLTIG